MNTDGRGVMKVVIVGGHSRIALLLTGLLSRQGHAVVGTVRSEGQGRDVVTAGGTPLLLETVTVQALTQALRGTDPVRQGDLPGFPRAGARAQQASLRHRRIWRRETRIDLP